MKKASDNSPLTTAFFSFVMLLSSLGIFATPAVKYNDPATASASPVSLIAFHAKSSKKLVNLEWSTRRETNTNVFIIQRSTDGKTFVEISRIVSGDDSYADKAYSFDDDRRIRNNAVIYYRLKIVDRDGQYVYSDVKMIAK